MIHHLDQGFEVVEISNDIEEANAVLRSDAKKIFFYYDDFLGTAFDAELPKNEDGRLINFLRRIEGQSNKRIVLTTREYILSAANLRYEKLATGTRFETKCTVSIADYTSRVRAKILYNHVYFSNLTLESRTALVRDATYMEVIEHENFSPRLIEHSVDFAESQNVSGDDFPDFMLEILSNPRRLWDHAYQNQLPQCAQSILLALLFLPRGPYIRDLRRAANAISVQRGHADISERTMRQQLKILEGSFVRIDKACAGSTCRIVEFDSPALNDYLLSLVNEENDCVEDLLAAAICFEQLANLSRAAATTEDSIVRFSGLKRALGQNVDLLVSQFSAHLETPTIVPRAQIPWYHDWYSYTSQPSVDARVRTIVQISNSLRLPRFTLFADNLIENAVERWKDHDGDRQEVAKLIRERNVPSLPQKELKEWALEDLHAADDFALAATLVDCMGNNVLPRGQIEEAYEDFVAGAEEYILYEAENAEEAWTSKYEVESVGKQVGLSPTWDEDEIDSAIACLDEPENDEFDYERARGAHRKEMDRSQSIREEIDGLFSTLVTGSGEG